MACYRAAIGGVAKSGGNRNWGKLDWIVEEKDRCWFVSCLFWMSHRAEWKGEHRFWRSSRWLIIPFRYAERICFSQYFWKQVFCSAVWSSVRAIFSMIWLAHEPNIPCSSTTKGMKVRLLTGLMYWHFFFFAASLSLMAYSFFIVSIL